jgi:hypothetical protein
MNTEKNSPSAKIITIISFVAVLLILAWSATQVVKLFPVAISSLASLADTVYNYEPNQIKNISVTADRSIINSGETLHIWWDKNDKSGSYTFNYTCKDGVAIDIKTEGKDFKSIACDNSYDIGLVDKIEMKIDSEKARFAEVKYNIAYFKTNASASTTSETKTVSVINSKVADKTKDITLNTNQGGKNNIPVKPKPIINKPTQEPIYTYEIPVSKPNGYTDILLSNLKIGLKNQTGTFIETSTIRKNMDGAVQFTVHNIGTKTSESWIFKVKLPGDTEYISESQKPLKPNERAIITISFSGTKDTNLQKISVLKLKLKPIEIKITMNVSTRR